MMLSPGSAKLPRFVLAAALLLLVCQPALAEKRVALVLGNSAYQNAPPLANPVNDGAVIAATLKGAGFDVVDSRHDLTALETRRALREFADRASALSNGMPFNCRYEWKPIAPKPTDRSRMAE